MPTIRDIIKRLFPKGSRNDDKWDLPPVWPPDLFAVAATIVQQSGCYASPDCSGTTEGLFHKQYREKVEKAGKLWMNESGDPPEPIPGWWKTLWNKGECEIHEIVPEVRNCALRLLASADHASSGIGFTKQPSKYATQTEEARRKAGQPASRFPDIANTLCDLVPAREVCVQPKSGTPQVGCTLRTLSHNLALLPGIGQVRTEWKQGLKKAMDPTPLNLLLVPFPYGIDGSAFRKGDKLDDGGASWQFSVSQSWLHQSTPESFVAFLLGLWTNAKNEVENLHGVVLPELALRLDMAQACARALGQLGAEMFISGVLKTNGGDQQSNCAYTALLDNGQSSEWCQNKHHRWCIDGSQISRYNLGHALFPSGRYWERTTLERSIHFSEFRVGATLCVLICEDLARIDPVQPVVRSIGPTLVIALLLDGPQYEYRWPGRYATVLADDPGSAVLTLTSLGMVRRSTRPGEPEPRQIGLFKGSSSDRAEELLLPSGAHGLVVTLRPQYVENWTLDGRSDAQEGRKGCGKGATVRMTLVGVRSVVAPCLPPWMQY